MGQDEILKDIIEHGKVLQKVLSDRHKSHGPFSSQLRKLRDKGLVDRVLVENEDVHRRVRVQWMYYPTAEALELYKKEVVE